MIPKQISYLVEKHLPAFYQAEGPNFIAFIEAYYEWLETSGQVTERSRQMLDLFDVDKSIDDFVTNFKTKYLANFPLLSETDQRTFIKRASEIYRSKGSERSIALLFRLLFNEDINVYYPSVDVLRPSVGKWVIPVYLELSIAPKTASFIGNLVTGARSGATAVVSRIARRTLAGKTYDVAYLTNITGDFQLNEIITYDGLIEGSPSVVGSLNSITIENAGQGFEVGDIVQVSSNATGRQALGRVAQTVPATGKILYNINDGGAGYALTSNVYISEKVFTITNLTSPSQYITAFQDGERITQDLTYVPFTTSSGAFANNQFIYGVDTASNPDAIIAAGYVVELSQNTTAGTGSLIINETTVSSIPLTSITNANTTGSFTVGEKVYQLLANTDFKKAIGFVLAANSTSATVDVSRGSFVSGERMIGLTTNCSANVGTQVIVNGHFTNASIDTVAAYYGATSPTALVISASVADRTVTANVVGSNATHIGVVDIDASRAFKSGTHAWVRGVSSGVRANVFTVSTGSVGGFEVGSITDEEQIYINTDIIGSNNAANVSFLSIRIDGSGDANGITSNVGFITSITVVNGGTSYSNADTVVLTGGSPSTLAAATINTHSNGTINVVTVTNLGAGYDSAPAITITTSTGSGANLQAIVDPGYGFVKNIHGDYFSVIDTCLTKLTMNVGTIASLTNINPGSNNTASPFVKVINEPVAGFGRRHFTVNISGNTKPFIIGEQITQVVNEPIVTINATGMSGAFNSTQRETVRQVRSDGNTVWGELISSTFVAGSNTGVLRVRVDNLSNTFNTSNVVVGLTSGSNATVGSITTNTSFTLAKGRVYANTATSIDIFRTRFGTSFAAGSTLFGAQSGAQATIDNVVEKPGTPVYGASAIIDAPAQAANGTIQQVDVFDSGFGYTNSEIVTLIANGNPYVATGVARLIKQGTGEGYWDDTGGFISSDKYIQDSDFYQDYSYQIQSTLSLERYVSVLKDTVHLAGTKLFGKIDRASLADSTIISEDLNNRNASLAVTGGNNNQLVRFEEIAQYSGSTKVANGYLDAVSVSVTVNGANNEFVYGEQVSRPTFFANTSYGTIESALSDYTSNTTTLVLSNVKGLFENSGQIQTNFDRMQLTYTLTSYTGGVGGGSPIEFSYPEVVYQSNGSANVGVGNITSVNSTHIIIKPAAKLYITNTIGTLTPGSNVYQRANSSSPNTAFGTVGLSNSTVLEVVDPRGSFVSGDKVYTSTGNAQVTALGGKSNLFTKSNTVIMRVANLTDIGFANGETIRQPATGAQGTLALGNTTYVTINDVAGSFDIINPIVGSTSGVQADVSSINGPFAIIGATTGANAEIIAVQYDRVLTTLTVNSSVGAINTLTVANVAGQFSYNGVITASNSSTNATITTVEIQAY
jgi:hypothetical protein